MQDQNLKKGFKYISELENKRMYEVAPEMFHVLVEAEELIRDLYPYADRYVTQYRLDRILSQVESVTERIFHASENSVNKT